ncbi:Uncharacterised protein r2_g3805 [Pycnogonum litorale]
MLEHLVLQDELDLLRLQSTLLQLSDVIQPIWWRIVDDIVDNFDHNSILLTKSSQLGSQDGGA